MPMISLISIIWGKIMKIKMLFTYLFIPLTFLLSALSFQSLDPQDIAYNELRDIVETASRANKKVWLEDFTGIN